MTRKSPATQGVPTCPVHNITLGIEPHTLPGKLGDVKKSQNPGMARGPRKPRKVKVTQPGFGPGTAGRPSQQTTPYKQTTRQLGPLRSPPNRDDDSKELLMETLCQFIEKLCEMKEYTQRGLDECLREKERIQRESPPALREDDVSDGVEDTDI